MEETAETVVEAFTEGIRKHGLKDPELRIEPGRFLVTESGHLLSRVTGVKQKETEYIGLDTGMHQLLRPSLLDSYHEIQKVDNTGGEDVEERTVVGPVCSSIDVIAEDRELPELEMGDLVSIEDVGAYGFVMASHWNSRPLPAEIIIENGNPRQIRSREQKEAVFKGTFLGN